MFIEELEPYEDEYSSDLRRIQKLAYLFDANFSVPGTKFRFGWDSIIGLVPVIGDMVTLIPQLYLFYDALKFKLGTRTMLKMLVNIDSSS